MRYSFLIFFMLLGLTTFSQITEKKKNKLLVIHAPQALPTEDTRIKIFLAGSIDMGETTNWQADIETKLANQNVILLNPRRDNWNKKWKLNSTDSNFRMQVKWELTSLELADIIVMYLAPSSKAPISLLELGLYARTKKLLVLCPEGFWRKGNVDIVCEYYGIKQYATMDSLQAELKKIIQTTEVTLTN